MQRSAVRSEGRAPHTRVIVAVVVKAFKTNSQQKSNQINASHLPTAVVAAVVVAVAAVVAVVVVAVVAAGLLHLPTVAASINFNTWLQAFIFVSSSLRTVCGRIDMFPW